MPGAINCLQTGSTLFSFMTRLGIFAIFSEKGKSSVLFTLCGELTVLVGEG
jgi:hypothetical protein